MLQFAITNLQIDDTTFEVPSVLGRWQFARAPNYDELVPKLEKGMCANTFYATNESVNPSIGDADFRAVFAEIVDICLVLSFLNARCVTPSGTTQFSSIQSIQLGDDFIRPRAIVGFEDLKVPSMTTLFVGWLPTSYSSYMKRGLRLQLSHWLSGLTCFSLEDIYLSAGVQMDIIKQHERVVSGNSQLTYMQGMTSASSRYGLTPLGQDYKNMRNDIVHEGVLSGSNFRGRSKAQCADVLADTLNWLDQYVLSVLDLAKQVSNVSRWRGAMLENNLPSISIR